jgi:hypothetical protein
MQKMTLTFTQEDPIAVEHKVRWLCDAQEQPDIIVPAGEREFTVCGQRGQQIELFIAPLDAEGKPGQARLATFKASATVPPRAVTALAVSSVIEIDDPVVDEDAAGDLDLATVLILVGDDHPVLPRGATCTVTAVRDGQVIVQEGETTAAFAAGDEFKYPGTKLMHNGKAIALSEFIKQNSPPAPTEPQELPASLAGSDRSPSSQCKAGVHNECPGASASQGPDGPAAKGWVCDCGCHKETPEPAIAT